MQMITYISFAKWNRNVFLRYVYFRWSSSALTSNQTAYRATHCDRTSSCTFCVSTKFGETFSIDNNARNDDILKARSYFEQTKSSLFFACLQWETFQVHNHKIMWALVFHVYSWTSRKYTRSLSPVVCNLTQNHLKFEVFTFKISFA